MKRFISFGPLYLPDSFECFGTSWTAGRWTASGRAKPFVERNRNYNNHAKINRNVNVNHNVNVNRNVNVNVHGGCYNCGYYYHDDSWNWGSFAAGAAVGVATTAVVAAATRPPSTTVVVQAPA